MKLTPLNLILAAFMMLSIPVKADEINPVLPYFNCYMGLSPYNDLPQELVGPRIVQHKTFNWIKGYIVLRHSRKTGEPGFYLVTPKAYYFVNLPSTYTALYLDLIIPQKPTDPGAWIRLSVTPTEVKSQETAKGFPPVEFPANAVFSKATLYEVLDPEFFLAIGEDLKKRATTLHDHFLKMKANPGTAVWSANEYQAAIQTCAQIPNPDLQATLKQELAKFEGDIVGATQTAQSPIQAPQKLELGFLSKGPLGPYLVKLEPMIRSIVEVARKLTPEDPKSLLKFLWIPFGFLAFRIVFYRYFSGAKVIKTFSKTYEMKAKRNARMPTFTGVIKNHLIEISHDALGKPNPTVRIAIGLRGGLPDKFEVRLKSREFAKLASDESDERKTDALDDEFFEKYMIVKAANPIEIGLFLTPWRKSILRQCMAKMDVSLSNAQLIYRHPSMFFELDKMETIVHSLLNTAVLLTPK